MATPAPEPSVARTPESPTAPSQCSAPRQAQREDLGTWIDWYYSWRDYPLVVTAILSGILVLYVGYGLACFADFAFRWQYIATPQIYLGVFGVAWVTGCVRWGGIRFPRYLAEIALCFPYKKKDRELAHKKSYEELAEHWLSWSCWRTGLVATTLVIVLSALVAACCWVYRFEIYPVILRSHRYFPDVWYEPPRFEKMLVLQWHALSCGMALGAALWLFMVNIPFLRQLSSLHVRPIPGIVVAKFRNLTFFYLVASYTWSVGVLLFAIFFFRRIDWVSGFVLLFLAFFSIITFFYPQLVFHRFLMRAQNELADSVARAYDSEKASPPPEVLSSMVQATQPGPTWVYNLKDATGLLLGQVLAPVALLLKGYLSHWFPQFGALWK